MIVKLLIILFLFILLFPSLYIICIYSLRRSIEKSTSIRELDRLEKLVDLLLKIKIPYYFMS